MVFAAHRWMGTAPDAPPVRAASDAVPQARAGRARGGRAAPEPVAEPHRRDDPDRVFESAHRRAIGRRAVLVQ